MGLALLRHDMGWAGLVKHGTGGADIQNKRGIFEGLARVLQEQKCLYSSWDLSSSGG